MKKTTFSSTLSFFILLFFGTFLGAQNIGNPPAWTWVNKIGGSGSDNGTDVTVDPNGNAYVSGVFNGAMKIGTQQLQSVGLNDGFLAKFAPDGTALWVKQFNADNADGEVFCQSVALDNSGNVVVAGHFKFGNLMVGASSKVLVGATDLFVAKFSSSGALTWLTSYGEPSSVINAVKVTTSTTGEIYCLSDSYVLKFSTTGTLDWTAAYPNSNSSSDIAWNNGTLFLGSTFNQDADINGTTLTSDEDAIYTCTVDTQTGALSNAVKLLECSYPFGYNLFLKSMIVKGPEEIYLSGQYYSDLSGGTCTVTSTTPPNGFVAKVGASGCSWLQAETTSIFGQVAVNKIALDANGNLYGGGNTNSGGITFGNVSLPAGSDGFLLKINAATGDVLSIKGSDVINSLATDATNNVFYTGMKGAGAYLNKSSSAGASVFASSFENDGGFCRISSLESDGSGIYIMGTVYGNTKLGSVTLTSPTVSMLLAKISLDGAQTLWHKELEGPSGVYFTEGGTVSYLDKSNGKFYAGGTFSKAFTYNGQTYTNPNASGVAFFVVQTGTDGSAGWLKVFPGVDYLSNVTTDNAGNVIVCGTFLTTATFGNTTLVSKGEQDFFIAKLDKNGNVLWAKRGGGEDVEYAAMASTDAQNNIYFVAETYSLQLDLNDAWSMLTEYGDGNLMFGKLTPNGDVSWIKLEGKSADYEEYCIPAAIKTDQAGNTYLAGIYGRSNSFGNITITSNYTFNNFVAKFNATGDALWATPIKTRRFSANYHEMDIDELGNVYMTNQIRDSLFIQNNVVTRQGSTVGRNFYIARFNGANGNLDWLKTQTGSAESTGAPTAISVHNHNSILCAGTFVDRMKFNNFQLNSYSGNAGFVGLLGSPIMVAVHTPEAGKTMLEISPNPASSFTTITAKEGGNNPLKVNIVNSQGVVVFQQEFKEIGAGQQIDLKQLPSGVYFLTVQLDNETETKRLVITH